MAYNLTRFLACWPDTLAQEDPFPDDWYNTANYSDTIGDPGGATEWNGIIQQEYSAYLAQNGLPDQSVRNITYAQGETIYLDSYWLPNCPSLVPGLDLCVFDTNVNMGPTMGTMILQYALGVIVIDGIWGPQTAGAVAGITSSIPIIDAYTARREAVYRTFGSFGEFGVDWIRRAQTIGSQSAAMAGAITLRISPPKRAPKAPSWFTWHDRVVKTRLDQQSEITVAANSILSSLDTWVDTYVPDILNYRQQALADMPSLAGNAATSAVGAIEAWRALQLQLKGTQS